MLRIRSRIHRTAGWLYGAYVTWRHVDVYERFPAVTFSGAILRVRIRNDRGRLILRGRLVVESWLGGTQPVTITIHRGAEVEFFGDTIIGDDVRLFAGPGSRLAVGGRRDESAAGFTAGTVVMAKESISIGVDCIVGWGSVITDCDWHQLGEGRATSPTIIGDHVWVGQGVKILKGATIGNDSVVAAASVVVGSVRTFQASSLIGGVPARVLRPAPPWRRDMAPD